MPALGGGHRRKLGRAGGSFVRNPRDLVLLRRRRGAIGHLGLLLDHRKPLLIVARCFVHDSPACWGWLQAGLWIMFAQLRSSGTRFPWSQVRSAAGPRGRVSSAGALSIGGGVSRGCCSYQRA